MQLKVHIAIFFCCQFYQSFNTFNNFLLRSFPERNERNCPNSLLNLTLWNVLKDHFLTAVGKMVTQTAQNHLMCSIDNVGFLYQSDFVDIIKGKINGNVIDTYLKCLEADTNKEKVIQCNE